MVMARSAFRVQLVGAGGVVSMMRKAQPEKEISVDVEGMLNEVRLTRQLYSFPFGSFVHVAEPGFSA